MWFGFRNRHQRHFQSHWWFQHWFWRKKWIPIRWFKFRWFRMLFPVIKFSMHVWILLPRTKSSHVFVCWRDCWDWRCFGVGICRWRWKGYRFARRWIFWNLVCFFYQSCWYPTHFGANLPDSGAGSNFIGSMPRTIRYTVGRWGP